MSVEVVEGSNPREGARRRRPSSPSVVVALAVGALGVAALSGLCAAGFASGTSGLALQALPVVPGLLLAALAFQRAWQAPRSALAPVLVSVAAFAWFAAFAARKASYRPEGDEPWYLAQADSIAQDHDLQVSPLELAERSAWYYGMPLPPDQLVQIRGRWRITHWPMLSLLLLPAAWAKSRLLAMLLVAAMVSCGLGSAAWAYGRLLGNPRRGVGVAAALLLASPLGEYGLLLFPDGVAAGVWLLALALLLDDPEGSAVLSGLAAGSLVWIKPSLAFVALAPAAAASLGALEVSPRVRRRFVGTVALCGAGFVAFQLRIYGQVELYPMPLALADFPGQVAASLFEPGRGLAVHHPLFGLGALATTGAAVWRLRQGEWLAAATCGLALGTVALPSLFSITSGTGGWCPPGRYWIAALPALTAVACALWGRSVLRAPRWVRGVGVALLVVGLSTNVVHLLDPRLAFSAGAHWVAKVGP